MAEVGALTVRDDERRLDLSEFGVEVREAGGDVSIVSDKEGDGEDEDGEPVPAPAEEPGLVSQDMEGAEDGVGVEIQSRVIESGGVP